MFGYGRFGKQLVREFAEAGCTTLVVEWDPFAKAEVDEAHLADRVSVIFGDANSPEFPETLPVRRAQWIISTVPDADTALVLATALRRHGATCPIAVTAHTQVAVERYRTALDDGTISLVLQPFRDAADDAIEALRQLSDSTRDSRDTHG